MEFHFQMASAIVEECFLGLDKYWYISLGLSDDLRVCLGISLIGAGKILTLKILGLEILMNSENPYLLRDFIG